MTSITTMQTAAAGLPALPQHMRKATTGANAEIASGLFAPFKVPPKLSIEGKVFRVIKDGAEFPITTTDNEGNRIPVSSLNVVVVAANFGTYKLFYGKDRGDGTLVQAKYNPNAEQERPACYSYDGITPSPYAGSPQSPTCQACPQNDWGSAVNDLGNKTRACSDNKLLAVIPLSAVKQMLAADAPGADIYSLKVSPTARSRNKEDRKADPANNTSLQEYVELLNTFPVEGGTCELPMREVVTNLHFEIKSQYALLRFKLAKTPWLTPEQIEYVASRVDGEDVRAIVSEMAQGPAPVRPALTVVKPPAPEPEPEPEIGMPAAAATPPPAATPARGRPRVSAAAAAKAALVDPEPTVGAQPPPAAAAPTREPPKAASADVDKDLAAVGAMFAS